MSVLVVNDTGVGTSVPCHTSQALKWDIKSFITHRLDPSSDMPYLVMLSHCHYDHILGLESLLDAPQDTEGLDTPSSDIRNRVTVLCSSHQPSFVTPYSVLEEHSLCKSNNMTAPIYETLIWAADHASIVYQHPSGAAMQLPITTLHTPGHTPDSLSWYDVEERTLYVGDSFYQQESDDSQDTPWGRESPAPMLFTNEAKLLDWWRSIGKLELFVKERNLEQGKRITLAAGHVTASVDAFDCLLRVKQFMAKILRNEAHFESQPSRRGEPFGHWTDRTEQHIPASFSVGAPVRIIQEGRQAIPEVEWRDSKAWYL